jgi:hypothetical protein
MFAPLVKAPKAKTASQTTPTCAPKPPQPTPLWPGAGPSNQAVFRSLRFEAQQAERPAESTFANHQMQEADPERIASRQGVQGASWDFTKVSVFAPDLPSRSEPPTPLLQRKVAIGPVNDPLEHEADRVADQVLRMPAGQTVALTAAPQVSRKCAQCEEGHEVQLKRAAPARGPAGEAPALVRQVLNSPGRPLDATTRAYFEPRFKYDFSAVRVHTDAQATESARQVNSLAYAIGTNVVFRSDTYAPDTPAGKGLLAHELTHVVQQRHAAANGPLALGRPGDLAEQEAELAANGVMSGRQAAFPAGSENAARVVRRSPGPRTPPTPSPPQWLGPLRARATHLQGDLWDVQISSLGRSPVGPHDQMQAYLRGFNQNRPPNVEAMESAHIVGGEHMRDLGWDMPYNKAPCIGVAASLHDKWTREISNLQSKQGPMGGRTTATAGRPIVGPDDVKALHHEVYRGIPELQQISGRIVDLEGRRVMAAKYGMPKPKPPMEAHQGGMPKPKSPMEAHQGGMPKPKSPMEAHQGGMPKPKSPMEAHQGGMPKPKSPMEAHQGGMPKPEPPMEAHQGGMPKPESPMEAHKGGMPKPKSPMEAHQGGMPKPEAPVEAPEGVILPKPTAALEPKVGFRARLSAAKGSFGAGLKAAFSAENIAAAIPEIVLAIADRVAARDAIRRIETKFAKEGFAKGVAAGVTGWTEEEVSSNLKNRVTAFRVQGLEDPAGFLTTAYILQLAEAYENYAVDLGYRFSSSKTLKWKADMRDKGFAALAKYGYQFARDPKVLLFEYDFIEKLAWVLRPTTNPIIDGAIEKGEERREAEARKIRQETGGVGMKV